MKDINAKLKKFLVGGAVRDKIMGKTPIDRDWVVINKTDKEMCDLGFIRIGKSSTCPVFVHPKDPFKEEYAIPRIEKSTGDGYNDFEWITKDVELGDDLKRRDFTINAMAMSGDCIIDLHGGQQDIKNKVIRHVNSESFVEDPLRVIRACRFAARFDFTIHPETIELCIKMKKTGAVDLISRDRVFAELKKVFRECNKPSLFFDHMINVHALHVLLPWIYRMISVAQPWEHHQEGNVYNHTMACLDYCKKISNPELEDRRLIAQCFSVLFHDVGKTLTPRREYPRHKNHTDQNAVVLMKYISRKLKMDNHTRDCCVRAVKYHMKYHLLEELRPIKILEILRVCKVKHTDELMDCLTWVGYCDEYGRLPRIFTHNAAMLSYIAKEYKNHKVVLRKDKEFTNIAIKNMVTQQEVYCVKQARKAFLERERESIAAVERDKSNIGKLILDNPLT